MQDNANNKKKDKQGSQDERDISARKMTVRATGQPRYKLADLMEEMPDEFPLVENWDAMSSVGHEKD
jgi:hypothetical protein